jgi:hypothetical protein
VQIPDGDLAVTVERAADLLIEQRMKQRFAQTKQKARAAAVAPAAEPSKEPSRYRDWVRNARDTRVFILCVSRMPHCGAPPHLQPSAAPQPLPAPGTFDAPGHFAVLHKLKSELNQFKHYPPGERFARFHERHSRSQSGWVKPLLIVLAVLSLAVGVVLVFIPGPAILFFAITAALVATQNHWVAVRFDRFELWIRKLLRSFRDKRRRA